MMRLDAVNQELAQKIRAATPRQCRLAGLAACETLFQVIPVPELVVSAAFDQLRNQGVLSDQKILELTDFSSQLDREYFNAQNKLEDEPDAEYEVIRLFSCARAVSALAFAGGEEPLESAMEAIYEASMAVDDASKVYDAVLLVL